MQNFSFRTAVRENVGMLIGFNGGTGSGKTYSAMRLAAGLSGAEPFAVIDTENGRALHYADQFKFDHCPLNPPFRPDNYWGAIEAAAKAGYKVIVVDSFSHEWAGEGGILDWQEEIFQAKGSKESMKMMSWVKPKMAHKKMVQRMLQVNAHLLLCFRAEEKVEMKRVDGKMKILPKASPTGLNGWIPICEKNLPYELTASFLMVADKPGIAHPIKLQEQHRAVIDLSKVIDESVGESLGKWAAGGIEKPVAEVEFLDIDQRKNLKCAWVDAGLSDTIAKAVITKLGYKSTAEIPKDKFGEVSEALKLAGKGEDNG